MAFATVLVVHESPAAAQCLSTESCLSVHPQPGCDSEACCLAVCNLDPTCCINDWDSNCVLFANASCAGYCGAEASGSCFAAHANPACDSADCCTAVCNIDPFCCSTTWDTNCALFAGFACPGNPGTCGITQASCFVPHSQGACNDVDCCNAVCSIDPSCCEQSWDTICVFTAEQVCVEGCLPVFEKGYAVEIEGCDVRLNDPCYAASGGVPEQLAVNIQVAGSLGRPPNSTNGPDVDVYSILLEDTDGDGQVRIIPSFVSSPSAWMALIPEGPCAPIGTSVLHLSSALCVDTVAEPVCVPAGQYRVVVSGGTFPEIGGNDIPCTFGNLYGVKIVTSELACDPCAPNGPSCYIPHATGGCNEPTCCAAICAGDPFCCDSTWDIECVNAALASCLTRPPANETCATAEVVTLGGEYPFNTGLASLEQPQPTTCTATFANDVWFVYDCDRTGEIDFQTCGTWFDTAIAIYEGTCKGLVEVGCNDDGIICGSFGASRVTLTVSCGARYYIRVGAEGTLDGEGLFRLTDFESFECPACPADLDGNGLVGAPDITILLNGWGTTGGDIDGNGTTDALDLAALLNAWGACP